MEHLIYLCLLAFQFPEELTQLVVGLFFCGVATSDHSME